MQKESAQKVEGSDGVTQGEYRDFAQSMQVLSYTKAQVELKPPRD